MENKQQSEMLIFANDRPSSIGDDLYQWASDAEDMIRRLHAESEQHLQELAAYRFTVENLLERVAELEAQLAESTHHTQQGLDVISGAIALCKHAAKIQNIDFDDYWKIHSDEFKEEAQLVLDAAQAKQGGV